VPARPPIVLVHGLWMTPRCWEHWVTHYEHYAKSAALTEYVEFPGRSHWTCGEPGWEQVADHALDWALAHARGVASPGAQV
jgi:hypothetical protein